MRKKVILSVLAVTAVVSSFIVGVIAADSIQNITAQINYGMTMRVNNQEWHPTETDGTEIRPIVYNDRTYLPVRAICDKLGVAVDYDANTQTVLIGENTVQTAPAEQADTEEWTPYAPGMDLIYGLETTYVDEHSIDTLREELNYGSETYNSGSFVMKSSLNNSKSESLKIFELVTGRKYNIMKLSIYSTGTDRELTISNRDTGEVYKVINVEAGVPMNDIEVDINGAFAVNVVLGAGDSNSFIVGDMWFK